MLDRLRRQFILIIMALVTAALAIMAGVIMYLNYQQVSNDVLSSVQYASTALAFEERDAFMREFAEGMQPLADDGFGMTDEYAEGNADGYFRKGEGPGQKQGQRQERAVGADIVATSVYVVEDGVVAYTLVDSLELESDDANAAASEAEKLYAACAAEECSGHLDGYGLYYSARETPRGLKVAFASDAYVTNSIGNLAMVLGIVSLCVWVAFLLVSIVLARWVVRPTQQAWAQQQQFVADASHELKTPLAVMMANNSILLANQDETVGSQLRWVESSQDEARQMLDLVNDMLFLARPDNAERQTVRESVDFSALVQRNALQFEAVCFERGIRLETDVADGIAVQGDANRLQRLVSTLVDNACKYADERVDIRLQREGARVKLAVANDGATIPPEDLPHVFDRFYRVDKARVRSEGGVGLGLAIAQEVAHEHGGAITVTSDSEHGTTFTATIPC